MEKLLWIDMEMTGLDVEKEVVIEVAAIITDLELNELDSYHAVVKQPQSFLDRMDDWNKSHHGASGLTAAVPSGREPGLVEEDLVRLVELHFPPSIGKPGEPAVLAGNSISQDRLFINKYFRRLASKLHYRMLDVTSWKIIFNERFRLKYEKQNTHRAVDDIRESIAEMKFYLSHIKKI
jgi:oligoribonuclease